MVFGYPHQASSWPHSQEVVARDFKDASPDDFDGAFGATPHGRAERQNLR